MRGEEDEEEMTDLFASVNEIFSVAAKERVILCFTTFEQS